MNAPERPACAALISYMHGDDDLWYQLRMIWEWKDDEFRRLVEISMRCLEEIEPDESIDRSVVYFFCSYLPSLERLMQQPDFIMFNREGRAESETKAYFAARIEIIHKLMSWVSNGKRPHPLTDFILPEWKAPQ